MKNRLITPEGTKDYLFEEVEARNLAAKRVSGVFKGRGFVEVQTPGIEFMDVFCEGEFGIPAEYLYKLSDAKGRLIALRADSTMPIARLCATRLQNKRLPLRLYYRQPVFSAEPVMRGRSDEVLQVGVEYIGGSGFAADLDILTAAADTLFSLGKGRVELGHIGIFNAAMQELALCEEQREQVRSLIETKNYPLLNDLLDSLDPEGKKPLCRAMKQLPRLFGGEEVFAKAKALFSGEEAIKALNELERLYHALCRIVPDADIMMDLGLVNRNDYYTGVVFCGYLEGIGKPVLLGGRYDNLLSRFGKSAPAVGFGVDIDACARYLARHEEIGVSSPDILLHAEEGFEEKAFLLQRKAISDGGICEVSAFETLEQAICYARENHIPQLIHVGAFGEVCLSVEEEKNA